MTARVWITRAETAQETRYAVSLTGTGGATRVADLATLTAARHAHRVAETDTATAETDTATGATLH